MSWLFIVVAYLIGSIPVGVILARAKGTDPRKTGSGNIGATNVARAAGKATGILTLAGDVLKGYLPVLWAIHSNHSPFFVALTGLAVFLGHLFPVYLGFRGGKGVATALGVYLAIEPAAIPLAFALFAVIFLLWRYVSLSSIVAAASLPFITTLLSRDPNYTYLAVIIAILIILKHRDNIKRLLNGTEHRLR